MCIGRPGRDAEVLQQVFANQMRGLPAGAADAEVDARLAEVDRQQLRVAVGEMQQVHVAEARQVVHALRRRRGRQHVARRDRHAGRGGSRQHLQEFPASHRHRVGLAA